MNVAHLILCVLCGFAVPSVIAPMARTSAYAAAGRWSGYDRSPFLVQWLFAFACGPAALAARLFTSLSERREMHVDLALGALAATGWAALYGYVLLGLVQIIIP
jgi:hypothetical protein